MMRVERMAREVEEASQRASTRDRARTLLWSSAAFVASVGALCVSVLLVVLTVRVVF